jgi:hypothetical protein
MRTLKVDQRGIAALNSPNLPAGKGATSFPT